MRNIYAHLTLIFVFACSIFSQTPTPTPTPQPADAEDVVKISTNLIQVDVTVTDKKGNVIRDLRSDEIEVYENGAKQPITNFSFISNVRERTEGDTVKTDKPAISLPPTTIRPENVRRAVALVVDDLTLSFESTYFVRRALKKFVDEQMRDGDLVAIIRTGAGIGALQQFTNDKRQLYAAIEKVKWNSIGSGGIGAFAPLEAKLNTGEPTPTPAPGERTPEGIERENNEFRESLFATGTLGAINYIVRGMAELPGRKSVLLLSDGFSLFTTDASGFKESGRVMDALRRLVDQANRASVVIHTMDARGLQVTGLTAADDTSGRSSDEIEQAMSDRRDKLFDTQAGLQYLARQTGGTSVINNNDLVGGIRKILDDQSYYLVGYEPDDATFDPKIRKFNKLEIKVTRPGTRVRYRSGFFGVTDDKIVKPEMTARQQIMNALTSPFAVNDISLRLNPLFGSTVGGAGGKAETFIRSFLHIRGQDLSFTTEPDGKKKAVFDIVAVGFGDNGTVADQLAKTYTLTMEKDLYERLVKSGFIYNFTFPVKKPGAYQLRVAIRDDATSKVGSASQFIEVPNLKKDRLTLSGVSLDNVTVDDYKKAANSKNPSAMSSDPLMATALRQFKRGTILSYGFAAYNAKPDASRHPNMTLKIRLFSDGKPIFEGKPQPVPTEGQTDPTVVNLSGSLVLGTNLIPGDYVLEIAVTDNLAKEKYKTSTQFVQFEIVQ